MEPHQVPGGALNALPALFHLPFNQLARQVFLSSLFRSRGREGSEGTGDLLEVTEPGSGRGRI